MPKARRTKQRKNQKHRTKRNYRLKKGGEETAPVPVPETTSKPPYILIECSLDENAKTLFASDVKADAVLSDGKFYFKIISIKKQDEKQNAPVIVKGWWNKTRELGDISNIVFEGLVVPSTHVKMKEGVKLKIDGVGIKFKFSKDLTKIVLVDDLISKAADELKFNLSSGKKELKYIPRSEDIFTGDIKTNFIETFPNKTIEKTD
jgi:hypothetical protein